MSKIAAVKGTRDFYPDIMAVRNWIVDGWKEISIRNGFVEYDSPIFEYLELYTRKSGDEIVSQLFSMTDRGGRDLAIRPEITPSLARMVNQQINALPRPVKWFSAPRLCRAERPQKGRLREFFQWNCDIVGSESILADAESIYTAVDYLRSVNLTADDIVVRISSRSMLAEVLKAMGFAEDQLNSIYVLLDKKPKVSDEAFAELAAEQIPDTNLRAKMMQLPEVKTLDDIDALAHTDAAKETVSELRELFSCLDNMGIGEYCRFDIQIVRGLAYYTGPVFEIFDRSESLRAICGGGRYDSLLTILGGPKVPATGFGMGDVVLEILLREKGKMPEFTSSIDYFVIDAGEDVFDRVLKLACDIRSKGKSASFSYKRQNMKKQFKQADNQHAKFAVIIGEETIERNEITVKELATGEQLSVNVDAFLSELG